MAISANKTMRDLWTAMLQVLSAMKALPQMAAGTAVGSADTGIPLLVARYDEAGATPLEGFYGRPQLTKGGDLRVSSRRFELEDGPLDEARESLGFGHDVPW